MENRYLDGAVEKAKKSIFCYAPLSEQQSGKTVCRNTENAALLGATAALSTHKSQSIDVALWPILLLALCAVSAFAQDVKLVKKPLLTPTDLSLYAGVLATRSLDYVTTERLLDRGGRELLLPSGLVHSKPAFAAFSLGSGAAEIYTSRRLAKHHPKLARYVLAVDISTAGAVAGHNAAILPKPVKVRP